MPLRLFPRAEEFLSDDVNSSHPERHASIAEAVKLGRWFRSRALLFSTLQQIVQSFNQLRQLLRILLLNDSFAQTLALLLIVG